MLTGDRLLTPPLRIGFLGGVPPALGGAGLEIQMERTASALRALGHEVVRVERATPDDSFDVLHVFGTEPPAWHALRHWRRNLCPLVVTAVIVVSPGRSEAALWVSARLPGVVAAGRMRREIVARADAIVAVTEYERRILVRALKADPAKVVVIGNAVDPVGEADLVPPDGLPERPFALMVGTVSQRKGQAEVVSELGGRVPVVVVGGFEGSVNDRERWERALAATGTVWLGELKDVARVRALQREALAFVHLSSAEGQSLAALEALALGTPVVASDIPSHRELRAACGDLVQLVDGPADVLPALERVKDVPRRPPAIPTWHDVATRLASVYRSILRQ